jgi:hypothetical protein
MKIPTAGFLLISSIVIATPTLASGPPTASPASSLRAALGLMMASAASPSATVGLATDQDQGDDHASLRAIQVVCSHDNPSATNSAICPTPISPD